MSLTAQTNKNWKCIVVFDGIAAFRQAPIAEIYQDERILYITLQKKVGSRKNHGNAGIVRNQAFPLISTEWTAFVDDDDFLSPDYVHILSESMKKYTKKDLFLFQAFFENCTKQNVFPNNHCVVHQKIMRDQVPISFAVRTSKITEFDLQFQNDDGEDFIFVHDFEKKGGQIALIDRVVYFVCKKG